jgi:hypothetical protein
LRPRRLQSHKAPTRIVLIPNQPFELGDIDSPIPQKALDPNFGAEMEFYEHFGNFRAGDESKGRRTRRRP